MKITCLIEDNGPGQFKVEHGLSLHIDQFNLLFDMGQSHSFIENAQELGISISKVQCAIISHGHYDHGGGLAHFLEENNSANIYIGNGAFSKRYADDNGSWRYIGLDRRLSDNPRIKSLKGDTTLFIGCDILVDIRDFFSPPIGNRKLYRISEDGVVKDDFRDEIVLIMESEDGLIVLTGCSHRGILNIIETIKRKYGKPIKALIGGFHIEAKEALNLLEPFKNIKEIYTGHCTSKEAYNILKENLENIKPLHTGTQIKIR
ncbi:MBL fold metallo-hydrolase [Methanothermobacter tenebrarum]|uniref:MBL fold metallo-hydrolase n=1 Tax=Methanothermobacter tenebrarum TaxID=680118 RepID=A0A328PJJ5_9EURY|nr:MBL fold metallo-hydrolase [Methanothermobacter tenebrarum]MBC7101178.1 MBL fold metallo-hydrolase [Methanobacteriales archaeon]MBC7118721.1 MBL fold metallo-hydrolase [Methanobacteriaceae archaeon]NPV65120.1 MBL fold metallo-hydrolase [Methanobacteriaceae archaeon]RAO79494.1 MBL fold metallo-hydrolase [Methanothermobacter tenebrarum]